MTPEPVTRHAGEVDWRARLHKLRWLAVVAGALLVAAAIVAYAVSTSAATDRGAVLVSVLAIAVPTALWLIDRRSQQRHTGDQPHAGKRLQPAAGTAAEPISPATDAGRESTSQPLITPSSPTVELVIGDDGTFVGGDGVVADVVLDLLDMPAAMRSVTVGAVPLEDVAYKRERPDQYARLRDNVQAYERALNRLIRGRVHYYWKWQVSDLVAAFLELRAITLPAQQDREPWYVWPADSPASAVTVWLDQPSVESIQTGNYQTQQRNGAVGDADGIPPDEPIWLRQIFPSIVWTRVVPAVLAQLDAADQQDEVNLDVSTWVLSDRSPADLARTRPTQPPSGWEPSAWTW